MQYKKVLKMREPNLSTSQTWEVSIFSSCVWFLEVAPSTLRSSGIKSKINWRIRSTEWFSTTTFAFEPSSFNAWTNTKHLWTWRFILFWNSWRLEGELVWYKFTNFSLKGAINVLPSFIFSNTPKNPDRLDKNTQKTYLLFRH